MFDYQQPDPSRDPRWKRWRGEDGSGDAPPPDGRTFISITPLVSFEFNHANGNPTAILHDPKIPPEVEKMIGRILGAMPFDPDLHNAGYRMVVRFERAPDA